MDNNYTRISNPAKFFIKDNPNAKDYNEYLLIARGDIKIKYTNVFPYPSNIADWNNCTAEELETLEYTAYRISYNSGETYPLLISNDNIVNLNFKLNMTDDTNIGDINNYEATSEILSGYTKCFTYDLISAEFFEKVKGTNTQVYINVSDTTDKEVLVKLDAPIVFEKFNDAYALKVLFTEAFCNKYAGRDCYLTFVFNL